MKKYLDTTLKSGSPLLIKLGKVQVMDKNIYDHAEKYIDSTDLLDEGMYWMGSKTRNTMCNKFTVMGADKKRSDDTKEKR